MFGFQSFLMGIGMISSVVVSSISMGIQAYLDPTADVLPELLGNQSSIAQSVDMTNETANIFDAINTAIHGESELRPSAFDQLYDYFEEKKALEEALEREEEPTLSGGDEPKQYSFLMSDENYKKYVETNGEIGRPSGVYVIESDQMDALLDETNNDPRLIESKLGTDPGSLGDGSFKRIDILEPKDGMSVPDSGNRFYREGGQTIGGYDEYLHPQIKTSEAEEGKHWKVSNIEAGSSQLSNDQRLRSVDNGINNRNERYNANLNEKLEKNEENYQNACKDADIKHNAQKDKINNSSLTNSQKENSLNKLEDTRCDEKNMAARDKLNANNQAVDEWCDSRKAAADDKYREKINGINNADWQRERDAVDYKEKLGKDNINQQFSNDLQKELSLPENQKKLNDIENEHKGNISAINNEYDRNKQNINGEYAGAKGVPEKEIEKQGKLQENENNRKNALDKENERYNQKNKEVIDNTDAMKNYKQRYGGIEEEAAKDRAASNDKYLQNKSNENPQARENEYQKATNDHNKELAQIEADRKNGKDRNQQEYNDNLKNNEKERDGGKKQNASDLDGKKQKQQTPSQNNGQGQSM